MLRHARIELQSDEKHRGSHIPLHIMKLHRLDHLCLEYYNQAIKGAYKCSMFENTALSYTEI